MSAATLEQDALTETYHDTEKLIQHTVHRFVESHGGKYDDLIELSGPLFMKAYHTYEMDRGAFPARLRFILWHGLLDAKRIASKRNGKVVFKDLQEEDYTAPRSFNLLEFMDELSEDARLVVQAVFETPWEFDPCPTQIRMMIREFLSQPAIGWDRERISKSFLEIRSALE